MAYFQKFSSLYYTLDDGKTVQIVTDVLKRIALSKELRDNTSVYDLYDINDGETPEIVANKVYGDPQLHWVLLIANDIIDPRFDWPMSYYNLLQYCIAKYGENQIYNHHHHVNSSNFITPDGRLLENESTFSSIIPIVFQSTNSIESELLLENTDLNLIPVTNFDYENEINESKRLIRIIKPAVVSEIDSLFTTLINI